ncbi:MAG TPA: NTP transferase domain-containing protein [Candidatus Limnocylindrales bacterium]|nr:NTP transferase domain-containing protein [Candidatus Limnocylindrales bacterium]
MTVAAVILAASAESALADADGSPAVRRIADAAWAGGATPIVVVSFDPDGSVAAALAGAAVTLAEPAPPEHGPAAQMARGADVARAEIDDTDAVLLWPARMTWVGPETVTSLIELHGTTPGTLLRPTWAGEAGWPVLLPLDLLPALRSVAADRMPLDVLEDLAVAGAPERLVELGDPGVAIDGGTPRADLPPYIGPEEPLVGHVHEWGAAQADAPDDGPLEGPALAPYSPAGEPG